MSNFRYRTVILLIVLTALIISCSDSPTEIEPKIEPLGYKVYFYDNGDNPKWYTYYPEEDILDSVNLPMRDGYTAAISPKGDRMYVDRGYGCEVVVVDLIEKTRLPDLTDMCGGVRIKFSPDNSRILVKGDQLNILDYETHAILVTDSTPTLSFPNFSADGTKLYGSERIDRKYYYSVYDATDFSLVSRDSIRRDDLNVWGGQTIATDDFSTWYIYSRTNGTAYNFMEWNADLDSILFIDSAFNIYPDPVMEISNDKHFIVYNNPGMSWDPLETRACEIRVYDTELHQLVDIIDTKYVNDAGDTTYYAVVELVITPDSKYLIAISHGGENIFLVYNLQTLEIERWVEIEGNHGFGTLLGQSEL